MGTETFCVCVFFSFGPLTCVLLCTETRCYKSFALPSLRRTLSMGGYAFSWPAFSLRADYPGMELCDCSCVVMKLCTIVRRFFRRAGRETDSGLMAKTEKGCLEKEKHNWRTVLPAVVRLKARIIVIRLRSCDPRTRAASAAKFSCQSGNACLISRAMAVREKANRTERVFAFWSAWFVSWGEGKCIILCLQCFPFCRTLWGSETKQRD